MNKKPKTLRTHLVVAFARAVFITAMVGGVAFVMQSLPQVAEQVESPNADVMDNRPNAKGSPAWFMEKHDCWTGEAPKDMQGVIPGHVVVTEGGRTFLGGPAKVGTALEVIFNDAKSEIEEIHGFCR